MVSLTVSNGCRSGILNIPALFLTRISLNDSEITESIVRLAPVRSASEGYENGSVRRIHALDEEWAGCQQLRCVSVTNL